jgi:hypothetical protein
VINSNPLVLENPNAGGGSWSFFLVDNGVAGPGNPAGALSIGTVGPAGGGLGGGPHYGKIVLDQTGDASVKTLTIRGQ